MPVYTSRSQHGGLRDYRQIIGSVTSDVIEATAKIHLIERLDKEFPNTEIWILTSHANVILMDAPTYDAGDWLVTICGVIGEEYHVSYRIPDSISPFTRDSEVRTTAVGIEQAFKVVRIAMRESGGWSASAELGR